MIAEDHPALRTNSEVMSEHSTSLLASSDNTLPRDPVEQVSWLSGALQPTPVTKSVVTKPDVQIRELPSSPGSIGLFISAALSIGAWQLVRSAKNIHLAPLPEWYHTGGPEQIGHIVLFNLDVDFASLPVCLFECSLTNGEAPSFPNHINDDPLPDCPHLSLATSRGPPSIA